MIVLIGIIEDKDSTILMVLIVESNRDGTGFYSDTPSRTERRPEDERRAGPNAPPSGSLMSPSHDFLT